LCPIEDSPVRQKHGQKGNIDYEEPESEEVREPARQVKKQKINNIPIKSIEDFPQVFSYLFPLNYIISLFLAN
jgi:hypothetical protein